MGLCHLKLSGFDTPDQSQYPELVGFAGEPITAVALGGSISAGHGVKDPGNGWVARIFTWISETFPNTEHKLLNRAIPATTSGYVSACVPDLVPEDADLVILEYTYNDYVFGAGSRTVNNPSRQVG